MTSDAAMENAIRLVQAAEFEPDLAKMERYEKLADSWIAIANLLTERERV